MAPATPPAAAPADRPTVADESLLEVLSAMTPEQRLRWNDRMAATVLELRHGFATAGPDHAPRPPGGERD